MFQNLPETTSFCRENGIKMLDFMITDFKGRWRHLTIPAERLTARALESGFGFDGSNYGFAPVEKSDLAFVPDLSSAYIDHFAEIPTLTMLGEVYVPDGPEKRRFEDDPRQVAYKAQKYMKKLGVADEMRLSPELEFYVFDRVSYSINANGSMHQVDSCQGEWNSGAEGPNLGYKIAKNGGYHMAPPLDTLGGFRTRATLMMEKQGISVKYHHHEAGGPSQLEIELEFGPMLEMADKTMMARHLLKNAALAEGKTLTFMPKPIHGEPGNGLHVHLHLFKEGRPLFYDEGGYSQLSRAALYFIGGLLSHAAALCAITNPSTNSYKRLVPGFAAPVTIGYATANRSGVIRIPAYARAPEEKRIEFRSPDASCNTYYAYAAILMAGLDGLEKKIDPEKEGYGPFDFNFYDLTAEEQKRLKTLPRSLSEALDALERDHAFLTAGDVFTSALINKWIETKRTEEAEYNKYPQPMEFAMYYDF